MAAIACAALLLSLLPALSSVAHADRPRVLVIHSYNSNTTWTTEIEKGIKETLAAEYGPVSLQLEYMDTRQYSGPDYRERLNSLLTLKLQGEKFDIVLTSDNDAFNFVLANRVTHFWTVPIVFCGVNFFDQSMLAGQSGITGIAEDVSVRETVSLALGLHPGTKRIVVTGFPSIPADKANRDAFVAQTRTGFEGLEFDYWDGLYTDDLVSRLPLLKAGTVVMINGITAEPKGHMLGYAETTRLIRAHSSVPLYTFWDVFHHGTLGGKMVRGYTQGRLAGSLAARILKGEAPDKIPVVHADSANEYLFDQNELIRFKISEDRLPAGSTITNKPSPFYVVNKAVVRTGIVILFGLACIIVALAINIAARRRAERSLMEGQRWQRALLDNITDLVWIKDREGRLLTANESFCRTFGWPDVEAILGKTDDELFPAELADRFRRDDEEVITSRTRKHFEESLEMEGGQVRWFDTIKAPVFDKLERVIGTVGSTREITERKRAEAALAQSEDKLKRILSDSPLPICWADEKGDVEFLNQAFIDLFGYRMEDIPTAQDWFVRAYPDQTFRKEAETKWQGRIDAARSEGTRVAPTEVDVTCKDGSVRTVEIRTTLLEDAILAIFNDISLRKRQEEALEKRIVALTQPLDAVDSLAFEDLFNLPDLQRLQDLTADAWGVAARITRLDGTPITQPSNFSYFCTEFIRKTEKGAGNCQVSDATLGRHNPSGPNIQLCLSAGLWGAGASITVGGRHIANWLIGQVRNEAQSEEQMMEYARELGADETAFREAYLKVPVMAQEKFEQIAHTLFALATQLSTTAYQNIQQARFIAERKQAELALRESQQMLKSVLDAIPVRVFWKDTGLSYLGCNRPFALDAGLSSPEEIPGKNDFEMAWLDQAERYRADDRQVIETGEPKLGYEEPQTTSAGKTRWLRTSKVPLLDTEGRTKGILGTYEDISERKRAEDALQESEQRFKTLSEASFEGIALTEKGVFVDLNEQLAQMFGYDRSELLGRKVMDMVAPESRERVAQAQKLDQSGPYEHVGLRKDGTTFPVEVRARSDLIGGRRLRISAIRDMTAHKAAEEALRQSEERFRRITENMADLVCQTDLLGTFEYVSPSYMHALGYSPDSMVGTSAFEFIHPDDRQGVIEIFREGFETGQPQETEYRYRHADGRYLWLRSYGNFLYEPDGTTSCAIIATRDVTERREAEAALLESETKFRTLTEHSGAAVFIAQGDLFVYANEAFHKLTGYDKEDLLTLKFWDLAHPDLRQTIRERGLGRWEGNDEPTRYETVVLTKSRKAVWVDVSASLIEYRGKPATLGTGVDITQRKLVEQQIKAALDEKEVLLREVHHRVKNNLQAIIYLINSESDQIDDKRIVQFLRELEERARTMALVYEQLYQSENLARIEMVQYLSDLGTNLMLAFGAGRNIPIMVEPGKIWLDVEIGMPCGLIVNELVTNALKHAFPPGTHEQGMIHVALRKEHKRYILKVSDDGVGLPPELRWREARSLGLRLVNLWATHQLGGTIEVEGPPGTAFTVTFKERRNRGIPNGHR